MASACGTTCDGTCGWCRLTAERDALKAKVTQHNRSFAGHAEPRKSNLYRLPQPLGVFNNSGIVVVLAGICIADLAILTYILPEKPADVSALHVVIFNASTNPGMIAVSVSARKT